MKNEWRDYLVTLKVSFEFLHADEFKAEYEIEATDLPAVFMKEKDELKMVIDSAAINACRAIEDLKRIINEKLDRAD